VLGKMPARAMVFLNPTHRYNKQWSCPQLLSLKGKRLGALKSVEFFASDVVLVSQVEYSGGLCLFSVSERAKCRDCAAKHCF